MGNENRVLESLRDWLLEAWLDSIEWDMPTLLEAVDRGIPETWAAAIEEQSGGRVSVKMWPHVIKSPRIAPKLARPAPRPAVNTEGFSAQQKIGVAMTRRWGEAQQILARQGITISALHRELQAKTLDLRKAGKGAEAEAWDYTRSSVSSWFSEDAKLARGIPKAIVDYLASKYGIPKTAWKKIL